MNNVTEITHSTNAHTNPENKPMIVFSEERKTAIQELKAIVRAKEAHSHKHFVLYAALRGQDIRKTSHLPQGENALEVLEQLQKAAKVYQDRYSFFFSHLKNSEGEYLFSKDRGNLSLLTDVLEEAKAVAESTPEANNGVNTMSMS